LHLNPQDVKIFFNSINDFLVKNKDKINDKNYYAEMKSFYNKKEQINSQKLELILCSEADGIKSENYHWFFSKGNYLYSLLTKQTSIQNKEQLINLIKNYYDKSIKINPNYAAAYINRGNLYCDLKKYNLALQDYNQAIKINPNDANAYFNRGNAYCNLKKYDLAIQDYNQAIKINPNDAYVYFNRGVLYKDHLKNYTLAIQDYNQAIKIKPDYANAYFNRGVLYKNHFKKYTLAIQDYNQAIKINPNYAIAYINRGILYKNHFKKYNLALQDYNKAIEIKPDYANARFARSELYNILSKVDKRTYQELTNKRKRERQNDDSYEDGSSEEKRPEKIRKKVSIDELVNPFWSNPMNLAEFFQHWNPDLNNQNVQQPYFTTIYKQP
jgi:tetratricopeptide (TPR) repeat protein